MKPLPLLISVPHAGLKMPAELSDLNILNAAEIAHDGDEGAAEIYTPLKEIVTHFVTTGIARAFVDLNRAEDDIRKDGVVKTHTCWDVPIYNRALEENEIERLLARYHRPYHEKLSKLAHRDVVLGIDCHTMADYGPPIGPDPNQKRPLACLGSVQHTTCSMEWTTVLADCLRREFGDNVSINKPFAGGYITQDHGREMPWVQLELSRDQVLTDIEKGIKIINAVATWCSWLTGNNSDSVLKKDLTPLCQ